MEQTTGHVAYVLPTERDGVVHAPDTTTGAQALVAPIDEHNATATHVTEPAHKEGGIHVALKAEQLGTWMGIPVTNTLVTSLVVSSALIFFGWLIGRSVKMVPGKIQLLMEEIFSYVESFVSATLEDAQLAKRYFPLLMSIFLFVAISNLAEFIPGVGSVGFYKGHEFIPLFRSINTDLNSTLALTIIVVVVIEAAGIVALGFWHYMSKFVNFSSPVNFFVGIVELVGELARVVSFSFRLFGNIFAGEVLIGVVTYFVPYILPVPLMAFEMFVGVVQGAIFMLLTLFFIKLATTEVH
ncbi:MAG: F0F1 ATP synthase subunit A [Minisyncoccia bacterium]